MDVNKTKLAIALLIGLTPMYDYASGSEFTTRDFSIRVVDKETKEPIEGMLMFTFWSIAPKSALEMELSTEDDLSEFYEQVKYWQVKEYLSDKNGWIRYKGWRETLPEDFIVLHSGADPKFFLYKEGYGDILFGNLVERGDDLDGHGPYSLYGKILRRHRMNAEKKAIKGLANIEFWNGETIEITKLKVGEAPTRVEDGSIYIFIKRVLFQADIECFWRTLPFSRLALLKINMLSQQQMQYWINQGAIEEKYSGMDPLEYSVRSSLGKKPCITYDEIKKKYL
ncbi:MAG: hypothetical protein AAF353_00045 [Pseudomonadota bacterium]